MLISCVCITTPSRAWCLPLAVECFRRQTHPDRELVIVIDGEGPLALPWLQPADGIRVVPLSGRETIGWKRNVGAALARGEVLATWDDDDWHHPERLADVVAAFTPEVNAVGCTTMLFHELVGERRSFRYRYNGTRPYLCGGSMAVRKEAWRAIGGWPHRTMAEDTHFAFKLCRDGRFALLPRDDRYVAMHHGRGHSGRRRWDPDPPRFELAADSVAELMGADLERYEAALAGAESSPSIRPVNSRHSAT